MIRLMLLRIHDVVSEPAHELIRDLILLAFILQPLVTIILFAFLVLGLPLVYFLVHPHLLDPDGRCVLANVP